MRKNITVGFFIFSAVSVVIFLALSLNTIMWQDDYEYTMLLKNNNPFLVIWDRYMNWDGRHLSISGLVQAFAFKYLSNSLTTFLWSVFWLISAWGLFEILNLKTLLLLKNKLSRFVFVFFISIILWHGLRPILFEVLYWETGGIYILINCLALIWLALLNKEKETSFNNALKVPLKKILFFIFGIFVALGSHNLTIALLTFSVFCIFEAFYFKNKEKTRFFVFIFISLLFGSLILFSAPGNFKRLSVEGGVKFEMNSLLYLLAKYLYYSKRLILFSFFFLIVILSFKPYQEKKKIITYKTFLFDLFFKTKWLWVAFSTTIIFLLSPILATPRTSLFFMFFLFLFIVEFGLFIFQYIKIKPNLWVGQILLFLFLTFNLYVSVKDYFKSLTLKNEIKARNEYVIQSKCKYVTLHPISKDKIPFIMRFRDITSDTKHWDNINYSKYFGLDSVILLVNDTIQ